MLDQLVEAAVLLAVGMTVVFSFLTMLIGGVTLIAWYAQANKDDQGKQSNQNNNNQNNKIKSSSTTVKPDIVAAISAAVHIHRQKQQ